MHLRPELFPTLLQKLQSSDVLQTQRVYLTLNQVLKELSTKRLGTDQKIFAQVSGLSAKAAAAKFALTYGDERLNVVVAVWNGC